MRAFPDAGVLLRLLFIVLVLVALPASLASASQPGADASYGLYAATDSGRTYQPLDPLTLHDLDAADALTFDSDWTQVAVSADGSTAVRIDPAQGPLEDWISVRDGLGGPERLAIDVEEAVFTPRLSADGSRLVVAPTTRCSPYGCDPRSWYTYDTHTGELISTVTLDLQDYVWPDVIDPAAERLYVPFYEGPPPLSYPATPTPPGISETGPWPLRIAAYNLDTGEEIGRMLVPEAFAGNWRDESMKPAYVTQLVEPAIALSPDGSTIAVVDTMMETLTLIDAGTLEVTETHAIHETESMGERLLGWLGLAPQEAEAKAWEGRTLRATFAVDGRHLYLTGNEMEIGETLEEISGHGFGLTRIDVSTGEIVETAMAGEVVNAVMPSPDGRWLYVTSPETPWWERESGAPDFDVFRINPETLEQEAERSFPDLPFVQLELVPSG